MLTGELLKLQKLKDFVYESRIAENILEDEKIVGCKILSKSQFPFDQFRNYLNLHRFVFFDFLLDTC